MAILVIVQRFTGAELHPAHRTLVLEHVGKMHALHMITDVPSVEPRPPADLTVEANRGLLADGEVLHHVGVQLTRVLASCNMWLQHYASSRTTHR